MISASSSNPRCARRRGRFPALAAALLVLGAVAGCGIGDSVADECITKQRLYEQAQKRASSLAVAGVSNDAAVHVAARERLARLRSDVEACAAQRARDAI